MKNYWYLFFVPVFMGLTACHDDNEEPKQRVSYLSCPDNHHPHMIDLGLPSGTLWSCCNVDTDHPEKQSPSNNGGYYAWSETKTKETYELSNYKFYGNSSDYHDLELEIAGTEDDVAHVEWKGDWQMPTKEQFKELIANCTYEWAEEKGINGGKFTSKTNGNIIFLPAAGLRFGSELHYARAIGHYLSSTLCDSYSAFNLALFMYFVDTYYNATFSYGYSIRPVSRK
jgi:hypothetical protein